MLRASVAAQGRLVRRRREGRSSVVCVLRAHTYSYLHVQEESHEDHDVFVVAREVCRDP